MLPRRRDFVHKRARFDFAARAPPTLPQVGQDDPPNPSSSVDPEATKVTGPLTPTAPDPKTADTPTAPASPPNPFPLTPTVAFSSHLPSPSSLTSTVFPTSDSRSVSFAASPAASVVSSSVTAVLSATPHVPSLTTQVVGVPFTPSSLSSSLPPSTAPSSHSSSGTNTAAIVGGVAGTLAGVAVLGFLLMWCMRRQRNRDIDDFDAQAFRRQSAVLVDDPVEPSRSYNPRPPTMIERHNASPALAAQAGYGGQNYYGSYGGYGQQAPYASEMVQPAVSPPPQAYGSPPMGYAGYNDPQQQIVGLPSNAGHAPYDAQQPLARQPSNAVYPTRQPNSAVGYVPRAVPPGSLDSDAHYIDLDRSSISPYQAAQYADISRQLSATEVKTEVPAEPVGLPEGPLPSPFDDPTAVTPSSHAHQDPQGSSTTAPIPPTQHNVTERQQRPVTVYEEGDAYGGI